MPSAPWLVWEGQSQASSRPQIRAWLTSPSIGPVLSVMVLPLIQQFDIGFTQVSLLTGYNLLAVGACAVFVSALSRKYGKRPVMLASLVLCFVGTILGGASLTYNSMAGARIVQGLGMAMFESVAFSVIGDLYHVHQRGSRLGIYVLSQSGIAHLPALIAGKISEDLGWRWVFWLLALFIGLGLVTSVFLGWETTWNRSTVGDVDVASHDVRCAGCKALTGCHRTILSLPRRVIRSISRTLNSGK